MELHFSTNWIYEYSMIIYYVFLNFYFCYESNLFVFLFPYTADPFS